MTVIGLSRFAPPIQVKPMEKQADPMQFLTAGQAAKLLNLPTHRIRIMIDRKELRALRVGTQWRIPRSEVSKWVEAHSDT